MFLFVVCVLSCGANVEPQDDGAYTGPTAVPYSRKPVPTALPSSTIDYRSGVTAPGLPLPEPGTSPTSPSQSETRPNPGAPSSGGSPASSSSSSSSSATSSTSVPAQVCQQYVQLLGLVDDIQKLVDPADPVATAQRVSPLVNASRAGLQQLLVSPQEGVRAETTIVVTWLDNKARGAPSNDLAFDGAKTALTEWLTTRC